MELEGRVTARVTKEEERKLSDLARAARRSKSDVLRLLINSVHPDQLRPGMIRFQTGGSNGFIETTMPGGNRAEGGY